MPIFEYKCEKCNSVFEMLVRSKKEGSCVACINCGSEKVDKLFSSFYSHVKNDRLKCESCPVKNCPKKHNL